MKESALAEALATLYAAPLDQFVAARREAVLRLRAAGEVAASRFIAAAGKPTRTAWALNQIARRRPDLVTAMVEAREAAAAAQSEGDAGGIREGAKKFRDALADVVRAAREELERAGLGLSAEQTRRMGETLQALAADDVARRALTAGRLTEDVPVEDPFAGLELPVRAKPIEESPPPPECKARVAESDEEARRARRAEEEERRREAEERTAREKQRAIDEARAAVAKAEEWLRTANAAAGAAEEALARARADADAARRALTKAEEDAQRARAHAKKIGA